MRTSENSPSRHLGEEGREEQGHLSPKLSSVIRLSALDQPRYVATPPIPLRVPVQPGAWGGTRILRLLPLARRGTGPRRLDGGRSHDEVGGLTGTSTSSLPISPSDASPESKTRSTETSSWRVGTTMLSRSLLTFFGP
jgi:hypothetical protein